jgi:hypothetical protein
MKPRGRVYAIGMALGQFNRPPAIGKVRPDGDDPINAGLGAARQDVVNLLDQFRKSQMCMRVD